jgi:hypothetical protein
MLNYLCASLCNYVRILESDVAGTNEVGVRWSAGQLVFVGGESRVAVRRDIKFAQSTIHITSHVTRRARLRVDGYKVVRRWAVQRSFQLSPHPLPSSQSTSANTDRSMSSPLPSPLASPKPAASSVGKKSPARSKSSRATKSSVTKKSTAAKKSTTVKKPTMKKTASKPLPLEHPSWKDIIKVHRPDTIRPFIDCAIGGHYSAS